METPIIGRTMINKTYSKTFLPLLRTTSMMANTSSIIIPQRSIIAPIIYMLGSQTGRMVILCCCNGCGFTYYLSCLSYYKTARILKKRHIYIRKRYYYQPMPEFFLYSPLVVVTVSLTIMTFAPVLK